VNGGLQFTVDYSYTNELKMKDKELLFTTAVTCFSSVVKKRIKTMFHSLSNFFRHVKNFRLKSKPSLCILCVICIKHT
jgi:hypothetical protein